MRKTGLVLMFALALSAIPASHAQDRRALPSAGPEYTIGIEDELRVVVWGESDLSLSVKVRPDGKITVPLVNDIDVVGMTSSQVRDVIAKELARYIREPSVTVIVEAIRSYRIYFIGELRRQGALNFYQPTRLLQGIAAAGGKTDYANKIVILREENGEEKRIELDYKKVANGTDENIHLRPGDTVILP